MARRQRGLWLLTVVGLALGACSGDDSSPTGSGGSSASGGTGGAGGAGGSSDPGGAGGSTSGGTAGTGGEAGSSGSSGAGGTDGNPDAGSGGTGAAGGTSGDAASEAPPTNDGGEAGKCLPAGTIAVTADHDGYFFDGGPVNPVLTLCRGNKYTFAIDAPGHPIYIRQQNGTSFVDGITGNHIFAGNLVFDVPQTAPDMLFYQCDIHEWMTGAILIVD